MKRMFMMALSVVILAACTGSSKTDGDSSLKPSALSWDSIADSVCFKVKGQDVCVKANVVVPSNNENVKKGVTEIFRQLGQDDDFTGYPDSLKVDTNDVRSLVRFLLESKAAWLKSDAEDLTGDLETPLSYTLDMYQLEETGNHVTFAFTEESMFSGPHPYYSCLGVSYLMPSGRKLTIADFSSDKTDEIRKEVQSVVKRNLTELSKGEDVDIDAALNLKNEDGSDRLLELPENGFYLLGDSMVFTYQTDEICSYAFGMPEAKIPLKQMKEKGWLGKELSDLVK